MWWIGVIVGVFWVGLLTLLIWYLVRAKKKWNVAVTPFYNALERAGFRTDRKSKMIFADDTVVSVSMRNQGKDTSFSGYYYTRYLSGSQVCVYITKPCSEHNQGELEKVIKVLKSL